mgnify:CR=1 FL=1
MIKNGSGKMDFFKLFSHPLRLQIMQYLAVNGQATTKQIAAAIPSASAPTVYRHINLLLNEGLLLIREKREVRGGAERVLAIDEARMTRAADESIDNTAWQYAMSLYAAFRQYALRPDVSPERDQLVLAGGVLTVTNAEFETFLSEMSALLHRYMQLPPAPDASARRIAIAAVPVDARETDAPEPPEQQHVL